jgi:hypothetical protein
LANSSLRFPTDPELRGDSLLIQNGQKYVVRSLSSGVSVTNKAPRYMIAVASFDPFANLLVDQFKPEAGARRVWIASAASNYVTQSPLTTKPDFTSYMTCGNQLLKLRFGKVSSIDLLANPFAPATSTPRSVLPLTTAEVGAAGCNDTRVAFTTYPRKGSLVYIDDLAG